VNKILLYLLPAAAASLLAFAVYHVYLSPAWKPLAPPPAAHSRPTFPTALAAVGVVEAGSQNVAVAAPQPGVVAGVEVEPGKRVARGDVLFRLDDRSLAAELQLRQARLATAEAQLARLVEPPRPEQLRGSEARIEEARGQLLAQEAALRKTQKLFEGKLAGENELEQQKQAVAAARGALAAAESADRLLRAGAWEADVAVARAQRDEAQALVAQARTELERLQVRAPIDGTVLQVNCRVGEACPDQHGRPPVVLGDLSRLHVRAELEEQQLARFRTSARAEAVPRGQPGRTYRLEFVRVEPLVVSKRASSGDIGERSDVRVLPLIYRLADPAPELYVGQQVDVFIRTEEKD
jgi:multidrug resistance efflux pump